VKLNHIDIQVADVPPVVQFLVDHFDLQPLTRLDSPALAILTDGHGFTLVIQRRKRETDALPEGFHIGFLVDDPAQVVRQHDRLAAAGLPVSAVQTNGRGTMCYCRGPGDLLVETGCRAGSGLALRTAR
jgi:catechol 2,3-dioxygenase-like lactoylglutathione lyase family enzyme